MNVLVVVDMQNDFVTGSLGSEEAVKIVDNVLKKVKNFDGEVIFTQDTHNYDYLDTFEGKMLPVEHCIKDSEGWQIINELKPYVKHVIEKPTFGSLELIKKLREFDKIDSITLIGLCTDICVISNALLLKAEFYETEIKVDSSCCAGVTPLSHNNALEAMKACHILID